MEGWTDKDIAEEYGISQQAVDAHFRRAIKKIVAANNKRWCEVFGGRWNMLEC
jgi:DNA-binding NarL/FixJ family response regulator